MRLYIYLVKQLRYNYNKRGFSMMALVPRLLGLNVLEHADNILDWLESHTSIHTTM